MKNVVCFFNTNKAWGGGEKWHFEAGQYLALQGLDVYYVTRTGSELTETAKKAGLRVLEVNCSRLSYLNPFKIREIRNLFLEQKTTSVITNLPQDFKLAGIAAAKAKLQHIIYRRGMPHPIKDKPINKKLITQIYTHIIANSQEVRNGLLMNTSSWFPRDKIQLIYNGVKLEQLPTSTESFYQRRGDELVLGNAGRLVEQKGQKFLLDLAAILKKRGVKFKLLIAGTGPLETDLRALARVNQVQEDVQFLGHVSEMPKFYNSIDLFVFPSLFEGLANTLVEAMAYRKPCIGLNLSSIPEVIQNEYNGFLIQPYDMEIMADKIMKLWSDKKLLEQFQSNAYQTVQQKFDYHQNMNKLVQILT